MGDSSINMGSDCEYTRHTKNRNTPHCLNESYCDYKSESKERAEGESGGIVRRHLCYNGGFEPFSFGIEPEKSPNLSRRLAEEIREYILMNSAVKESIFG